MDRPDLDAIEARLNGPYPGFYVNLAALVAYVRELEADLRAAAARACGLDIVDAVLDGALDDIPPEEVQPTARRVLLLRGECDRIVRENTALRTQLAAYTDIPPEHEPSPLAAFLDVLAVDNCPNEVGVGGGDCGSVP